MDNKTIKRGTAQSMLCVDNKKDKTQLKAMCDWNFADSVSSRQFCELCDFSAIAENHWPYCIIIPVDPWGHSSVHCYVMQWGVAWWLSLWIAADSNTNFEGAGPTLFALRVGGCQISRKKTVVRIQFG